MRVSETVFLYKERETDRSRMKKVTSLTGLYNSQDTRKVPQFTSSGMSLMLFLILEFLPVDSCRFQNMQTRTDGHGFLTMRIKNLRLWVLYGDL